MGMSELVVPERHHRGNGGWAFPALLVEVWGELACFTRPELKSERVSYPVMTPSAAKGLLEAIFWKPEFQYVVQGIEILAPIRWTRFRRNEVGSVVTASQVKALRSGHASRYDVEGDRDQRGTTALRDVRYRIHAQIVTAADAKAPEEKYREQLRRRVERGACFSQPFLGCREFTASFGPADRSYEMVPVDDELGLMLHSILYTPEGERYRWFRASLEKGFLSVPIAPMPDDEVLMPAGSWRTVAGVKRCCCSG